MPKSHEEIIQLDPPSKSDARLPHAAPNQRRQPTEKQSRNAMQRLGVGLFQHRRKHKPKKVSIILKSLPKGYILEYKGRFVITGHPSKKSFYSIASFLQHLIWLDASSESKQVKLNCKCSVCEAARNRSQNATTSPASSSSSASMVDSDLPADSPELPDASQTIRLTPVTGVLIKPLENNCYIPPATFSIPLPNLKTADESVLVNSVRLVHHARKRVGLS